MKKGIKDKLTKSIIIIILALIAAGPFGFFLRIIINEPRNEVAYAANDRPTVPVYAVTDAGLSEAGSITRGIKVDKYPEKIAVDGKTYSRLIDGESLLGNTGSQDTGENNSSEIDDNNAEPATEANEQEYYIADENLVLSPKQVVQENEVYVRTPATIYKAEKGPDIVSFAAKGSALKVTGYDELMPDGKVRRYKVEYGEGESAGEGYIYGKYAAYSKEDADAVYNAVYDRVKNDNYGMELYGGKAANLDYYPFEKVSVEGNEFCSDARTMYINAEAALNPAPYTKLIKSSNCNAVVIAIKDGALTYKSPVAKKISPSSYKSAYASARDFKKGVDAYKETGAYLIGRIVVFNDAVYAKDHPEDCIKYKGDEGWPSAFSRNVWEYNVKLAVEAVNEFGFNEIQFDYVRFPETAYEMSKSGKADFRNAYKEEKGQAVQNFCMYASDQIREAGAYFSVDVFGESAYGYMTAYGQYWPGIANVADAISAMPYTDHMGADGSWEEPYKTMLSWSKKAKNQQDKIENPAAARTWITGYNTPHWDPTVDYDAKKMQDQVKALKKAGLSGGFIPWNASSDLSKYRQYKSVWE